jgi:hypothetical protein
MWASIFTIAVAAAICLTTINLASEINKIQEARHSAVVEYSTPSSAPASERATDTGGIANQTSVRDPGA